MTNQVHRVAQYLATTGISFLEKKEDDSHTNLGFNSVKGYLETRPLNNRGFKIAFDYNQFSLHWLTNETIAQTFLLDGKTHEEIIKWITQITNTLDENKRFAYELHYDLPYEKITNTFTFQKPNQEELDRLLALRTIAQAAMGKIVHDMNLDTTIRIWPHHFDTGGFVTLNNESNTSVGFGMAIPDTLVDDHYFYVSGYQGHDSIDTEGFNVLPLGKWYNEDFKGAVLPATGIDQKTAALFLSEAFSAYIN